MWKRMHWILVPALHGCGSVPPPSGERTVCPVFEAVRGGQEAPERQWDAVGALGKLGASGDFASFCTGVAVTTRTVLTAKHCVEHDLAGIIQGGGPTYFGIGADVARLRTIVSVLDARTASPDSGGYTGLGSDIALVTLASDLDVTPMPIAREPLTSDDLGRSFIVVGYGAATRAGREEPPAERRKGVQTLRAVEGNLFDLFYGSRAAFLADAPRDEGLGDGSCGTPKAAPAALAEQLERQYDAGGLLTGYEIWAGDEPEDAQTCHGDSGGPLVELHDGRPEIVGIASWSWKSDSAACDYGTVYAVFGPSVRPLLEAFIE